MKRLVIAFALLAGCEGFAVVHQVDTGHPCAAIAVARDGGSTAAVNAGIRDLRTRGGFTEQELGLIARGEIAPGMSERAGLCALGDNGYVLATTPVGTAAPTVTYRRAVTAQPLVLYVSNGVVIGAH